jgi:putative LysE/RhtB family amino acid efflux pump
MAALATGFGLGFLVAAGVGPIWLLCLRTSVRFGFPSGFAVGAGAAAVDTLYAALGVAGAAGLLAIDPLRITLGAVGAVVLAVLGLRTMWSAFRVRLGGEATAEVASPRRAFATSLAATASNPMTILSWAAVFSAASTAGADRPLPLVAGVGLGSVAWFTILSLSASLARRRVGNRTVQIVDVVSGAGILGFAGVLGYKTLR